MNIDKCHKIRHSLAHIMAQAVQTLYPGTQLGFGPAIDDGFYYDFVLAPHSITENDLEKIEALMRDIISQKQPFIQSVLPIDKAIAYLESKNEPYKAEYAKELQAQGINQISFYENGPFKDMCEGPHVENTKDIPIDCFKLRSLAGAYWRGSEANIMMTRIYAWGFENNKALKAHIKKWQLAQERDHKKLGSALGIYAIDDKIGKGLPLWLPNGTFIREALEDYCKELEFKAGYQRVSTPHIAKASLYEETGHLPYYQEAMYPLLELNEQDQKKQSAYALRPMNCPHHHRIFAQTKHSYRDLPLRLTEYGQVYRHEESGALSGLLRVRGLCINDAHIYCRKSQIKSEFESVIKLNQQLYDTLGLKDYKIRLSKHAPNDQQKYIHDPDSWDFSEQIIEDILSSLNIPFEVGVGEAAFYGPKIDVQFKTVSGREETVSTVQLDFAIAKRMGLFYIDENGEKQMPYIIHRAPLSTHERMISFLLEHYGGAFPVWLAPIQLRIIPVSQEFESFAKQIVENLRADYIRAEIAPGNDTVSKQVKLGTNLKIPYLAVIGKKEKSLGTVSVRIRGAGKKLIEIPVDELHNILKTKIKSRDLILEF